MTVIDISDNSIIIQRMSHLYVFEEDKMSKYTGDLVALLFAE
jgi:hypothetical protein